MKTKKTIIFRRSLIFFLLIWAGTVFGQNCIYSSHFDKNSPKPVISGWNNYVTEVKDSKLQITMDGENGNQWYSWTLGYVAQDGTAKPVDFSIPGNRPVVRFRARATDTVTVSVYLVDTKEVVLGNDETRPFAIIDLTTEYKDFTMDFSGLFYNWDAKRTKVDSTSIKGIIFEANNAYEQKPHINSFGQLVNHAFGGTIEFDWIGTGAGCFLPENYLNFSVPKKICKDSLVELVDYSGNFVNEPQVLLNPGDDGVIVSHSGNKYSLKYTAVGEKTIEMSFAQSGIAPSYIELVKVKDCSPGSYDQKIVGYISAHGDASNVDYANLSHAMFAFLNVKPDGSIGAFDDYQANSFEKFLAATAKANTKRVISIRGSAYALSAGWTGIEEVAKSAGAIHNFADTIVKFCLHHQLDGVDMDWEGLSTPIERDRYTQLIDTLEKHLHASHLLLTATLPFNSYWGQWFADAALKKADWLQIMVYDATGTWAQSPFGNHSSFQHLTEAESYWTSRGYDREKLVMGVPFYGYKFASKSGGIATSYTYKDIVALFPLMDNSMNQTPGNDLTLFNGPDLLKQKCRYLKEKDFGGVMIWEMTQDAFAHKSLHQHMVCAFKDDIGCSAFEPCTTGDISTGLVGQWDFDGNANDKSGNGNDGAIVHGQLSYDRYGNANQAIGSADSLYVNYGSNASLRLDNLTISAWVNHAAQDVTKPMVILSKKAGCGYSYQIYLIYNIVVVWVNSGNENYNFVSSTRLMPGNWYHIAFSHSYENGSRLYINGLMDQQNTMQFHVLQEVTGATCTDASLALGFTKQAHYKGKIDDVRIYDRELTQCDIDELFYPFYSNEKTNPTTGIVDKEETADVTVYPNPSNGNFYISYPGALTGEGVVIITNAMGQKVGEFPLTKSITEVQQELEEGIYCLTISLGNKRHSKKIVIQHNVK